MIVRVHALTKRYGERVVLDGVDAEIASGTLVAIVGGNGAGKSTFLRCIAGLLDHEGEIERPDPPIGFLPQSVLLPQAATVGEIVRLFARLGRGTEDVPLPVERERRVGRLSGGEQQRVALAALLAMRARLLLLDEPTADLDAGARAELFAELRRQRDSGTTVILTTPAPFAHELAPVADRIFTLENTHLGGGDATAYFAGAPE